MEEFTIEQMPVRISVIIPARDEARSIAKVVAEARNISADTEVIVVCNGTSDDTADKAKKAGAKVVSTKKSLGHDVGRAVGACFAQGDVLLFIDGDFVIPASTLLGYIELVDKGWDLVLNAYSGFQVKTNIHSTAVAKRFLNRIIGRPDLEGSSMTTVPHAMSRRALNLIGIKILAVPPKAQVEAVLHGLRITRGPRINTSRFNRKRAGRKEKVMDLVLGDHLEAIAYFISQRGQRAGYTDFNRMRQLLDAHGSSHSRGVYYPYMLEI
ncbi:glycosyltransferase [Brevibacillus sp. SYP-B805]|uniref:glycosyltransferase family 2 protein n=1 Tax=Brevibacillus sp. SYP-B805 TaxID=1578199 RepID=UPI0013EB5452|nr:glycosyltransferase [Brevibacillus sp. SYP-B805]NGQ95715.1 glycosyltransferase [Brevibacillus sp. SYP-B805]